MVGPCLTLLHRQKMDMPLSLQSVEHHQSSHGPGISVTPMQLIWNHDPIGHPWLEHLNNVPSTSTT